MKLVQSLGKPIEDEATLSIVWTSMVACAVVKEGKQTCSSNIFHQEICARFVTSIAFLENSIFLKLVEFHDFRDVETLDDFEFNVSVFEYFVPSPLIFQFQYFESPVFLLCLD